MTHWTDKLTKPQMDAMRRVAKAEDSVLAGFWTGLRRVARGVPFSRDLVAAYHCATDAQTPVRVKAVLFGALAYFVLPVDAVPDLLPMIGFADDAAVLAAAIATVRDAITAEHRRRAEETLADDQISAL